MKKWLLRIALLVGSPLLLLVLIELVWQMSGDPRIAENQAWLNTRPEHFRLASLGCIQNDPDPEVSFVLTPGFRAEVDGKQYRINSHGMRGAAIDVQKPTGTRRILILGDSYAFGFGVDDHDTIAAQLQRQLTASKPGRDPLQVLNMGVPGYQTGQQLKRLARDGMRFSPDLVVLVYYANDNVEAVFRWDPRLKLTYVDELPLPGSLKQFLARSILYARITKGYSATIADRLDSRGAMGLRHNWPTTSARLQAIKKLCDQHHAPLILVALPGLDSSAAFIDPEHDFNTDHDRVLARAQALALPTVDFRRSLLHWSLSGKGDLPESALTSPTSLRAFIAARAGLPADEMTPPLIMQGLVALDVVPKPIEAAFIGPEPPKKDSHLNPEGYALLVRDLVSLIETRGLLR